MTFPNSAFEDHLRHEPTRLRALLEYVYDEILDIQDVALGVWRTGKRTDEQRLELIAIRAADIQSALNEIDAVMKTGAPSGVASLQRAAFHAGQMGETDFSQQLKDTAKRLEQLEDKLSKDNR